jgi:hypothetical protein
MRACAVRPNDQSNGAQSGLFRDIVADHKSDPFGPQSQIGKGDPRDFSYQAVAVAAQIMDLSLIRAESPESLGFRRSPIVEPIWTA